MSGDYTRVTFDPAKVFSGVHKQQGRVSLDADFNEFEEILDRRHRSTAYDTFGGSVVPSTTKNGFDIGVAGNGLTIGIGRAYVDGIQAECFGDLAKPATAQFDAAVGNLRATTPLPFDSQPFHYGPTLPGTAGFPAIATKAEEINLVYLDVWQREVTSWEDERLLEVALGGPDTATRVQTAWQVKAITPKSTGWDCANLPPEWQALAAPSTARLTAEASGPAVTPGPCVVQPAGGYTGLENRLYRVEVHTAGTLAGPNPATFKWSRDNASLVASVLGIVAAGTDSIITVDSTGRDTWMRFEVSQQIELLDDFVELAMRDSGLSGTVARIKNVNHATGQITVDKNLAAFPVVAKQHPRIRRWDTMAPADPAVRNVTNGTKLVLEDGIKISFGDGTPAHDGDTLHAGDYWVFAARTANGLIDVVDAAPPRGILHHFMPLRIVTSAKPPVLGDDCRNPWPVPCDCEGGGCECDFCVTLESHQSLGLTIYEAIKQAIAAGGGTICIGPGVFNLDGPGLVVSNAVAIRIRGSGLTTILDYYGQQPALLIDRAADIVVRDLVVVTHRDAETAYNAIELGNAAVVTLERLGVVEDPASLLETVENGFSSRPLGAAIALHGLLVGGTIRDSLLLGGAGVAVRDVSEAESQPYLVMADVAITDNVVFATADGIRLDGRSGTPAVVSLDRLALLRNSIYGCLRSGVTLAGVAPLRGLDSLSEIGGSTLGVIGDGIVVGLNGAAVADNVVVSLLERRPVDDRDPGARGIVLVGANEARLSDVRVDANRVARFRGGGVVVDARVDVATVTGNEIRRCGGGVVMSEESSGERVSIRENTILELPFDAPGGSRATFGISLMAATRGEVIDNYVQQVLPAIGV